MSDNTEEVDERTEQELRDRIAELEAERRQSPEQRAEAERVASGEQLLKALKAQTTGWVGDAA